MKNINSQHGGDSYGLGDILDFSANLHPLGMPPALKKQLQDSISLCQSYPDPLCRDVSKAIAQRDQVAKEQILCGNGAADLIFRLCQQIQPKKALITAPTFGEYAQALGNCHIERHFLYPEENFDLNDDILEKLSPDLDILFLCSPNNPTGRCIKPALLQEIAQKCEENSIYFVLDQCFLEFSMTSQPMTTLLSNPFVILLRAFTKSYAIAGIRFGYCLCSNHILMEKLRFGAQPWSVSTLAQVAGISACALPHWPKLGRDIIQAERPKLEQSLSQVGAEFWHSDANYILFHLGKCRNFQEINLKKGILIRSCANYEGLGAGYYRIAIKKEEDNQLLQKAWKEVGVCGL